jgi:hypothetical protein
MIAQDLGEILNQVIAMFKRDIATLPFDWHESINKELQVLVNCAIELPAVKILAGLDGLKQCELLLTIVKLPNAVECAAEPPVEFDLVARTLNLLGKFLKVPESRLQLVQSTII